MPPEMPAPGAESRYFWSRPAEIRERAPRPVRGTVEGRRGLAILEPLASRFFFTLRLPISIVDAKAAAAAPSSQVAAHRLPPTPRAPPEPPPHAAAPPLHAAASGRRNAATAAADARRRDAQRHQRPPHATPTAPHTHNHYQSRKQRYQKLITEPSRNWGRAPSPRSTRWRDEVIEVFIMLVRGSTSARCRRRSWPTP